MLNELINNYKIYDKNLYALYENSNTKQKEWLLFVCIQKMIWHSDLRSKNQINSNLIY